MVKGRTVGCPSFAKILLPREVFLKTVIQQHKFMSNTILKKIATHLAS